MSTALTILVAVLAIYALFKIGEFFLKIFLGLLVLGLIAYLIADYIGLNLWALF